MSDITVGELTLLTYLLPFVYPFVTQGNCDLNTLLKRSYPQSQVLLSDTVLCSGEQRI